MKRRMELTTAENRRRTWRGWRMGMGRMLPVALLLAGGGAASGAEAWEHYGTAEFSDGWIMPYFDGKGYDRSWMIDVDKLPGEEIYRLVDPYHQPGFSGQFDQAPNTPEAHHIVVDCTDADYVRVAYQVVFTFAEGTYAAGREQPVWGQSRAAFLEELGRSEQVIAGAGLNCTFRDGIITIRECYVGFTEQAASGGQMWNAGVADTVVRLIPASVDAAEADAVDCNGGGTAEYFNMQGARTDAPVEGNLYIEKRGTEVRKVRF